MHRITTLKPKGGGRKEILILYGNIHTCNHGFEDAILLKHIFFPIKAQTRENNIWDMALIESIEYFLRHFQFSYF